MLQIEKVTEILTSTPLMKWRYPNIWMPPNISLLFFNKEGQEVHFVVEGKSGCEQHIRELPPQFNLIHKGRRRVMLNLLMMILNSWMAMILDIILECRMTHI